MGRNACSNNRAKQKQDIPIITLRLPPTALTLAAGKHAKIVITKSNWRWHVNASSLKKTNGSLVKMKEEEQQENIIGVWERSRATAARALWKGKHNNIRIVQYVFSYPIGGEEACSINTLTGSTKCVRKMQNLGNPTKHELLNMHLGTIARRYTGISSVVSADLECITWLTCEEVHTCLFCGLCCFVYLECII